METNKDYIKAELKARKLTQTVLARRLHCSLPFLNQVITGVRTSKRIQGGIAAYIGKSFAELWPEQQTDKEAA